MKFHFRNECFLTPKLRYGNYADQRPRFVQLEYEFVYRLVWQDDGIVVDSMAQGE